MIATTRSFSQVTCFYVQSWREHLDRHPISPSYIALHEQGIDWLIAQRMTYPTQWLSPTCGHTDSRATRGKPNRWQTPSFAEVSSLNGDRDKERTWQRAEWLLYYANL